MGTPLPPFLQIEPVGQCNLRCQMCAIQFRDDRPPEGGPAHMPFERFARLVDQFPSATELHLQGLGEPLMHPRFFDMVRYAAGKGMRVTTNTNMTLLTPSAAEECITSGLACVHMSLDGATAATYESIRARAQFERVIRHFRLLSDVRRHHRSATPRLHLVMVVMRRNLGELPQVVQLAADYGLDEMFVQHLSHDFGETALPPRYRSMRDFVESETLLRLPQEEVQRAFEQARRLAADLGLPLRLPRIPPRSHGAETRGRARCDWPWRGSYISYQGLAMPCCMISTPDRLHFGDMAQHGVETVWSGPAYEDFRRRLDSSEPPEVCRSCALYHGTF